MKDRERALASLRQQIADRLRPVCTHLKPSDFEELVRRLAELQFRFQHRPSRPIRLSPRSA